MDFFCCQRTRFHRPSGEDAEKNVRIRGVAGQGRSTRRGMEMTFCSESCIIEFDCDLQGNCLHRRKQKGVRIYEVFFHEYSYGQHLH